MPDAIDFPPSAAVAPPMPTIGDVWPPSGLARWRYDGNSVWRSLGQPTLPTSGGTLTQAYTSSATPPTNTALPWLDTTDQTWNTYDDAQGVWVLTSGTSGKDGADALSPTAVTITTADHTLVPENALAYLRFTATAAKRLLIPAVGTAITVGNIVTVRNAGTTGNITILPAALSSSAINFTAGADVVAPKTTAQLIYLGSDVWDIL